MTIVHRRVAGGLLLALTAVVSLLAGSVLLSPASAEDSGSDAPQDVTTVQIAAEDADGEISCEVLATDFEVIELDETLIPGAGIAVSAALDESSDAVEAVSRSRPHPATSRERST